MEIQLPATIDDYCKQLSPSRRKKIRYGLKHGLRAEWGGPEAIPTFYKIFATNMRNLGTPVYPSTFFENQMRRLPRHDPDLEPMGWCKTRRSVIRDRPSRYARASVGCVSSRSPERRKRL